MQWEATANAGFSTVEPWLPLAPDFATRNAVTQASHPRSMLQLYRALLALRRREPALAVGGYALVKASENVLAYERRHGRRRLFVALNFGSRFEELDGVPAEARLLLSTHLDREGESFTLTPMWLRPHEGIVAELTQIP